MIVIRVVGCVAVMLAAAGSAASAQTAPAQDPQKAAVTRQILETTHAADQMLLVVESSVSAQKVANPRIPAVFWDRFLERARAQRGMLVDSLVPVYGNTFSLEELKGLLAFYQGPIGQRLLANQPKITQESMQLGQQWGARIGAEIGQQLAAEGVKIDP